LQKLLNIAKIALYGDFVQNVQYWTKIAKKYRIRQKQSICQLSAGIMEKNGKSAEKKRK
jgi:hypothetical protein